MKKVLLSSLLLFIAGNIVYAGMTTEKEIGPCTSKNKYGFCVESRTHYCASISRYNGRCEMWFSKSKSDYDNTMEQFKKFNQGIVEGVKPTSSQSKTTNKTNNKQNNYAEIQKQKAQQQVEAKAKALELEKATIPNSIKLSQSLETIDKRIQLLQNKQAAGVDVSSELELLSYKSDKLRKLNNQRVDYYRANENLKQGILTKVEYDDIIAKIRKKDIEIATPYNQIIAITTDVMEKEKAEAKALTEAQQKAQRKKDIGKRLINHGSYYLPSSANSWIKQGTDVLELLK